MITSIDQLDLDKRYTYADYLTWRLDEYVELIRGKIFRMSPAPNKRHQIAVFELGVQLHPYFKTKVCQVFLAPFDVQLPLSKIEGETSTVVQPDLLVVCDPEKITKQCCIGAPDLVVEILSPSTSQKDIKDKYELYEEAGVREYWIVDPINEVLDQFVLEEGRYQLRKKYAGQATVPAAIFPGLEIDLKVVFQED